MKIVALVTEAYGGFGGIAQANKDLILSLVECGLVNSVEVLPRHGSADLKTILDARIHQKSPTKNKFLYSLKAFFLLVQNRDADLIFCGHLYMAPLVWILSKIFKIPYWIHTHGIEAWERPGGQILKAVESACLVTAVSRYTRRKILGWADIDPMKIRVLPNAIGDRFSPGPKPKYLLTRYKLNGKKVFLTVGRISAAEKYKGHDRMIAAMPEIVNRFPRAVYVIAGDGDDKPRLEALVKTHALETSVLFIGKPSEKELPDIYRMADVFVMPSTGEGFGIVFLEAVMSGLPVIGGNIDGSTDALRDGCLGHLIDPQCSKQLIDAILACLGPAENVDTDKSLKAGVFRIQNLQSNIQRIFTNINI